MLRLLGNLRGLRVQLLLWLALPLTLILAVVTIGGISIHQQAMRQMVEELDARSARLTAAHISAELAMRSSLLSSLAQAPNLATDQSAARFFDGGVARFDATGQLVEALPSVDAWHARPMAGLLAAARAASTSSSTLFSPVFLDPFLRRYSVVLGQVNQQHQLVAGTVSLEALGLNELVAQPHPPSQAGGVTIFLVDAKGRVIYHPDQALLGQNLKDHEGVAAVIQGQTGATYHRAANGQELAVGYAPVVGPGWGLIVQEPWEALVSPIMRFSLLAPLTVVVATLVSSLAVTFGLRYVVRPLQKLDRQAARLAWGDFTAVTEPVGGVQEIEELRQTLAEMAAQIQRYQAGMRDYVAAVTLAQEEERKRLARELHDETAQALIALGQRIEMAQKALDKDPEKARQRLAELSVLASDAQQEVRRLSRALRPLYLEDLGFVPALEMLAQEVERQNGLAVSVKTLGTICRLAPDLELTAYRIAQEGLSNVVRHAQAQNAELTIIFAGDGLTLRLQDNGQGFEPPLNPTGLAHAGHFGLMGLRERILLLGGRLEIHSQPGQGTTLEVFLPLNSTDNQSSTSLS